MTFFSRLEYPDSADLYRECLIAVKDIIDSGLTMDIKSEITNKPMAVELAIYRVSELIIEYCKERGKISYDELSFISLEINEVLGAFHQGIIQLKVPREYICLEDRVKENVAKMQEKVDNFNYEFGKAMKKFGKKCKRTASETKRKICETLGVGQDKQED